MVTTRCNLIFKNNIMIKMSTISTRSIQSQRRHRCRLDRHLSHHSNEELDLKLLHLMEILASKRIILHLPPNSRQIIDDLSSWEILMLEKLVCGSVTFSTTRKELTYRCSKRQSVTATFSRSHWLMDTPTTTFRLGTS